MLESKTDYYRLLSEAFGPVVPSARETRKKIYDGVRKALKEQAKLAPLRFDLAAEQRALEKAILDVEISAKRGEEIPRWMPGTTPPKVSFHHQPLQMPPPAPPAPAPYTSTEPAAAPDPLLAYTPSPPPPSGPRIEWADPAAIPPDEQGSYLPPEQQMAPLPQTSPVRRQSSRSFQPTFLNRSDRVSYARRADPPPAPPPPPAPKYEAPPPPPLPPRKPAGEPPEAAERPAPKSPAPKPPGKPEEINRLDNAPPKQGKFSRPAEKSAKSSRGGLRITVIVLLAACLGGAIAYFVKPEQLIRQLVAEFRGGETATEPSPQPPAGPSVSIGEAPSGTAQDHVQLAIAQTGRREFSTALATLEQAAKLGASGADFHVARAYAHWGAGNVERAIADYGEAIRLDPGNATHYANRAVAYNTRGEYVMAIRDLERAIAIDPSNPDNWNSRCWARALAGQLQEAIVDCNESLRLRPNDPNTLDSRGFANLKAGQNTRALADFNAVLKLAPQTASSLYGRGLARMRTGDRVNGANDIAEAKTISPNIEELFTRYGIR